jgi:hypothetical protein
MDAEIGEYFGTLLPSHFGDFTTEYAAARSAGHLAQKRRQNRAVGTLLISLAARSGGVHIVGAIFMGFYFDAAKEMQRAIPIGVLESEIRVFPTRDSYCSTVGPSCGCDSDCSHRPNPASVRSRAALSDSVLAVHFTDVISVEGMGNVVAEMPHIVPVGVVQGVPIAPTYKLS